MRFLLLGSTLSVFVQALALLLAGSPCPVHAIDNLIPEWLPDCFDEDRTFNEMFDCLRDNSGGGCFGFWEFWNIVGCVIDDLRDFDSSKLGDGSFLRYFFTLTRECLDDYVDCVNETIQELIEDIEDTFGCVNTTFRSLAECAVEHHDECKESCNNTDIWDESNNPFTDLLDATLSQCSGIQDGIITPTCEVFDCCPQCLNEFELLMECVVNDVLNYTDTPCDFECPSNTRLLSSTAKDNMDENKEERRHHRGLDETSEQDQISAQCTQFMPGLTAQTAHELGIRSAFFVPCLTNEFVNLVESEVATDDSDNTTPAPVAPATPDTAPPTKSPVGDPTGPTSGSNGGGTTGAGSDDVSGATGGGDRTPAPNPSPPSAPSPPSGQEGKENSTSGGASFFKSSNAVLGNCAAVAVLVHLGTLVLF